MRMESIFPTPLGFFSFDRSLSSDEEAFLLNQETYANECNSVSTDRYILNKEGMKDIRTFVENCLDQYFKFVFSPRYETTLRLTQSWINYTKPGQSHHKHSHANAFISGVFYVKVNKDSDKIYFYRDLTNQRLVVTQNEFNMWNSSSWWFNVSDGGLILFPSHLTHSVETVQGGDTRVSLAFNAFPVGILGEESLLTALKV